MKKFIYAVMALGLIYLFSSSFFIVLVSPHEQELVGNYKSEYDNKQYSLSILSNGESIFTVKKDNIVIYQDKCKAWGVNKLDYRTLPIYYLSFKECDKMDSSSILERDMFFNILIGNNGSELKRIDPDANVFYRKKES